MAIALAVKEALNSASMIRKMFEEGLELKKQYGNDKVFDFSLGNPDLDPPPAFNTILSRLAEEDAAGRAKGKHGYMPNAGFSEVREILAKKASADQKCKVPASHIVMSVGAAGGLNVVFRCILNPGDEVIVPKPYFMEYRSYIKNYGGVLRETESLPDFSLDLKAIEKALSSKTAAVLINSPHNPTGRVYPDRDIAELSAILQSHGKKTGRLPYLVADEPYREIVYDGINAAPVLSAYDESIVVTSYSKSLSLPGERIGYIAAGPNIGDADLLLGALIFATRTLGFVNAPALMQRIVAKLSGEQVAVDIYRRRRDTFMETLDSADLEYVKPQGAFYIFVKVPPARNIKTPNEYNDDSADDLLFSQCLKKQLILGVPGSSFAAPGWIRFAYCVDEKIIRASTGAFIKAVEEWKTL